MAKSIDVLIFKLKESDSEELLFIKHKLFIRACNKQAGYKEAK